MKRHQLMTLFIMLGATALTGPVMANNNNMGSSLTPPPTVANLSGSSGVKLLSGSARHGTVIEPIAGFTRNQCNISLSGVPTKRDGSYKRSRHFSLYYQTAGTGWRIRAGNRNIQTNSLSSVSNTTIQYQIVCAS